MTSIKPAYNSINPQHIVEVFLGQMMNKAYEIHNPSFNDMNLEEQIEHGINDWAVEGKSGHLYFGRTASEAVAIARSFDFK
jgi:hypothetical protein